MRRFSMRRLSTIFLVGFMFLSVGSQAGWNQIWDKEVGIVVVDQNLLDGTTRLFATDKATGDLYSYNAVSHGWTRASGPARSFVSSGDGLYRLSSDGRTTSRYITPDNWESISGGSALSLIGGGNKLYALKGANRDLYVFTGSSFRLIRDGRGTEFAAGGCEYTENPPEWYGFICKINGTRDDLGVWKYKGLSDSTPVWKKIGGPAKLLYVGVQSVFATDPVTGNIFRYRTGTDWEQVGYDGKMWAIDITTNMRPPSREFRETLYGLIPSGNEIYQWGGKPDPDDWTRIDTTDLDRAKPLRSIHAGGGQLYAVGKAGRLWKYSP
jgi:hypothetical protein